MGDSINALLQGQRASTVLQGIANPPVVNPLAAISAGTQAASQVYDLRAKQANQALGQILQQATDENGNVDYQKAQHLAAGAGPIVQAGMQSYLTNNAQLRGAQIAQASALNNFVGGLAADGMRDTSDANWASIRARAVNAGLPPNAVAEIDRIAALPENQRGAEAYKHAIARMDVLSQMARSPYPMPVVTQFGGTTAPVVMTPGSPSNAPGMVVGGGVAHTVGPDTYYRPQDNPILLDENNNVTTDPSKAKRAIPRVTPGGPAMGMPPPGTVSGPQGGGGGPPSAPGALPPGAPQPPPGQRLVGGRFVSQPPAAPSAAPSVAPPATTPPPTPGATAPSAGAAAPTQPPAVRPPASATPPGGGVVTGLPTGQEKMTENDQGAYQADTAAIPNVTQQARNTAKAYEALRLLKEANSTTGQGAAAINAIRSRLTTLGISSAQSMNVQKLQEEFGKYTQQAILDAAGPSSNMGKEMAAHSNPGDILSMAANFDVLRKNLGETLQKIAAQKTHENESGVGYLKHRADVASATDPRGFVWDAYDDAEKAKIMAEAKRDGPAAVSKLNTAIGMAHSLNLRIPGATTPPPPDRRSLLIPPQLMQNPLQMTG